MNTNACETHSNSNSNSNSNSKLELELEWKPNPDKCQGCVSRVSKTYGNIGCEYCDEYWDIPDLVSYDEIVAQKDDNNSINDNYCEGCELLKEGKGGENQMGHRCMGF